MHSVQCLPHGLRMSSVNTRKRHWTAVFMLNSACVVLYFLRKNWNRNIWLVSIGFILLDNEMISLIH